MQAYVSVFLELFEFSEIRNPAPPIVGHESGHHVDPMRKGALGCAVGAIHHNLPAASDSDAMALPWHCHGIAKGMITTRTETGCIQIVIQCRIHLLSRP